MAKLSLNTFIVSWNANGINSHLDELLNFLETTSNKPDFICIQETKINNNLLPMIPGYESIHTYRDISQGGCSTIYVKNSISFTEIEKNYLHRYKCRSSRDRKSVV